MTVLDCYKCPHCSFRYLPERASMYYTCALHNFKPVNAISICPALPGLRRRPHIAAGER